MSSTTQLPYELRVIQPNFLCCTAYEWYNTTSSQYKTKLNFLQFQFFVIKFNLNLLTNSIIDSAKGKNLPLVVTSSELWDCSGTVESLEVRRQRGTSVGSSIADCPLSSIKRMEQHRNNIIWKCAP